MSTLFPANSKDFLFEDLETAPAFPYDIANAVTRARTFGLEEDEIRRIVESRGLKMEDIEANLADRKIATRFLAGMGIALSVAIVAYAATRPSESVDSSRINTAGEVEKVLGEEK